MQGVNLCLLLLILINAFATYESHKLKSELLCSQCSGCETSRCPPSESYPHMTAVDNSLIAGALQSDFVSSDDRGVYYVPDTESSKGNTYYGWESTSGSASGYHRFRNYMDKCSEGQSYLTANKHGKVRLASLGSLDNLADADWKSINPPPELNHREFRFWVNRRTAKCLTVLHRSKGEKRLVGVADCKFDGSNIFQLFAFRFHYHNAFCCCNVHNH